MKDWGGYPKCLNRFLLLFWLVLLLLTYSGLVSAEETTNQYSELQQSYENLYVKLNRLVILSQSDLMQLQEQLPELMQQAEKLNNDLKSLMLRAQSLVQESGKLTQQLTELKSETEKLLVSLEDSERSMRILDSQIKQIKLKNNITFSISVISLIAIIGKIVYDLFK